ncbi:uncharacterized protein LOC124531200 [Vanessa cardui]|uniref:uncharacterized protein LOC124531200 n=1 Tax=Vanessa cardui TaxID=171605 RepID=UPI001F132389|nr:uncharacterized protein LOC124531200 [Vanessa cardui]
MFSHSKLNLLARNEGKIKSYESCFDIRAWSHDTDTRVRYLRDWIKSDMPICVIPVSTVTNSLRMMSWRRRGKVTPRCHPDCKSKVVLDSICNSCHVIKNCFKDEIFQKYFEEEEFETSYWPCERCLEALKSIKMFWKIILERVLKINFPKSSDSDGSQYNNESVKGIAKIWQQEVVEQAIFVKSLTPFIKEELSQNSLTPRSKHRSAETSSHKVMKKDASTITNFITHCYGVSKRNSPTLCKKLSTCTLFKYKTVDVCCGIDSVNKEENVLYKHNLDYLQQRFNQQSDELRQLKRENISLKLELSNMRQNVAPSYKPVFVSDSNAVVPKPYESNFDDIDTEPVKNIDSEMIITMKNCKNKNFRHVSMLQVLHKTNDVIAKESMNENYLRKNEDPIEVLTKVHDTFGAIVKRELTIANKNKSHRKDVNVNSYHRVNTYKYDKTVSARSSYSDLSDGIFVSTTDVL